MKKIITIALNICLIFALAGCGNQQNTVINSTTTAAESQTETQTETQSETQTETQVEVQTETTAAETIETTEETSGTEIVETGAHTLVVYFSNTGNTRAIAELIAAGTEADIYEIIAEVPYTTADLDYGDNNSRSTLEMNDTSARPAISGTVENMDQYDVIYIGYPIWWGYAPRILDTFVESYDFTGKTVIPFATSASSGFGSSGSRLETLAGSGNWLDGRRFSGSESESVVMDWVNQLGIE